ncbi:MAG: terminase small subunit protein [Hyphomicrobiales bacterium]|nr:MAG: terminase small subunit protein [Hyphomicrobiales bacterium]
MPAKVKTARKTKFTKKLWNQILEYLMDGLTLRQIANRDGIPSKATIMRWIADFPERKVDYDAARELLIDAMEDEILAIADDGTNDWNFRENGLKSIDHDHINRSRLRVDARKWILSHRRPKTYGAPTQMVIIETKTTDKSKLSAEDLAAALGEVLMQGKSRMAGSAD